LKSFFDSTPPALNPEDIVLTFTGKKGSELSLPPRVVITFDRGSLNSLLKHSQTTTIDAWKSFRTMYKVEGKQTIITKSSAGGPNIATLVEELSSFGVTEFILLGYCGGIDGKIRIGDVLLVNGAIREEGTSYHYLSDTNKFIYTDWFETWEYTLTMPGFYKGIVWSCDALYRETQKKIKKYKKRGIVAVEMEVASFYAVCKFKKLKGIAFLVVSDVFNNGKWTPGFFAEDFKQGFDRLSYFIMQNVIV